jgi:hypothetical protein
MTLVKRERQTMKIALGPQECTFRPWRPADGRIFDSCALDTETTLIDEERPALTPAYVLGAASDGKQGVFLPREHLLAFFSAHAQTRFIFHNAAFDLRVLNQTLRPGVDVYQLVECNQVWDTMILARLYSLATKGHTARGKSSLADCVRTYLGIELPKDGKDDKGQTVRVNFGQFLGKPPSAIPEIYLQYLGKDVLGTWLLFTKLKHLVNEVLVTSRNVWGFVDESWLKDVIRRFGPLTHHVQVRAAILMDALTATGIAIDQRRSAEKTRRLDELLEAARKRLREHGYLPGEKGCEKALQSIISELKRKEPDLPLAKTPTGKWSTAEENLAELAEEFSFFADLRTYRTCEKLKATYLRKMSKPRVHARFGYLLATGRTYCGGGLNLQNLPKEKDEKEAAATVRGSFVPDEGHVFLDADYSQIELVVLAHAFKTQFRLGDTMAGLINAGEDLHRRIAAAVLNKSLSDIVKSERDSAKPVSFGRPGAMGAPRLQRIAKVSYNLDLTLDEVEERIAAYHRLCPELDGFLLDEHDSGLVIAETLGLTPVRYAAATGSWCRSDDPVSHRPAAWLGGMLRKVLGEEVPVTRQGQGRPYREEEISFLWEAARSLPVELSPALTSALLERRPSLELRNAVGNWAGCRPVFTLTGRLRAGATFCSSRNCIFQGPAADGAILGLWLVWRAGFRVVNFVHDQIVVSAPEDDQTTTRIGEIEKLMKQGMEMVVPGMLVKVETCVSRSLNKKDVVAVGPDR